MRYIGGGSGLKVTLFVVIKGGRGRLVSYIFRTVKLFGPHGFKPVTSRIVNVGGRGLFFRPCLPLRIGP